jgi:hypothetical protein
MYSKLPNHSKNNNSIFIRLSYNGKYYSVSKGRERDEEKSMNLLKWQVSSDNREGGNSYSK